ncbi:hypothetical protein ES703_70894 [subsurface metagenome]
MLCDYCMLRGQICRHFRALMSLENPRYGEFCPMLLAGSVKPATPPGPLKQPSKVETPSQEARDA